MDVLIRRVGRRGRRRRVSVPCLGRLGAWRVDARSAGGRGGKDDSAMSGSDGRLVVGALAGAALAGAAARDLLQREHAIVRNFPLIGRLRFVLESVGPELRQYIVTSN